MFFVFVSSQRYGYSPRMPMYPRAPVVIEELAPRIVVEEVHQSTLVYPFIK